MRELKCGWCGRLSKWDPEAPATRWAISRGAAAIARLELECQHCGAEHFPVFHDERLIGRVVLVRDRPVTPISRFRINGPVAPLSFEEAMESAKQTERTVEQYLIHVAAIPVGLTGMRHMAYDPHTGDALVWGDPPDDPDPAAILAAARLHLAPEERDA